MHDDAVAPPLEAAGGPEGELARRIAAAPAGQIDRAAEAELCRRLRPRLVRYGLRHLRDRDAAADLAHQVLALTLERLRAGALREPGRIVSFVFGACRMTVLDLRRGEQRRGALLERFGDALAIADLDAPPRLDHARMADCLERLDERGRAVIVHSFCDEQPAEAVGRALGLSAGNVRVIRHRSLARLRRCMGVADGAGASAR